MAKEKKEGLVSLEEYINEAIPGNEFTTDEERIQALIALHKDFREYMAKLEEFSAAYPELFGKLTQMLSGEIKPQALFAEIHPDGDSYQAFLDSDESGDIKELAAARRQAQADAKKREENYAATIEAWVKKRGLTEAQYDKLGAVITSFLSAFQDGKLTGKELEDILDEFLRVVTYDDDIAAAKAEGQKQRSAAAAQAQAAAQRQGGNPAMPPAAQSSRGANSSNRPTIKPENDLPAGLEGVNRFR